jgi:hypothetical protein
MDLSQNIGLAYVIAEKRIPFALAMVICTQPGISTTQKKYRRVMRQCKKELKWEIGNARIRLKEINKGVKESLEISRKKKLG